ncbi:unnamed protein product [Fraxinus pennsylvanica]|uniref:Uncharacterized protein n=1 Tax=Fraxinus pennsylvanica TaxID=56036 RepID=A0AAD2DXZ7_9LAMI|nr:unnamed protein product [Fraxinus pennsylvanica]
MVPEKQVTGRNQKEEKLAHATVQNEEEHCRELTNCAQKTCRDQGQNHGYHMKWFWRRLKDSVQKKEAVKLAEKSHRKRNKDARRGDADRVIASLKPKHSTGKTQRP